MIVVDTNVLAYLYLPGIFTAAAEQLLLEQPAWAAPRLWRSEFRNILAGYVRRGILSFDEACAVQREAEVLLAGAEYDVNSPRVLQLVRNSDCSAYDCEFVALAQQLNVRLYTMDKKVLRAFPGDALPLPGG
ncbi:type II toxin-antitoxin system VapC family toxin [Azohydromonas aeria]|uniref:type II toxin-antitoxin system VapC family toxin n=1 Tax=Azohydromonas aeria TaxID=2590212 RepID=UPI0012F8B1AC|nr:type II toxin-antitoxin system VapC family toxin [Azohydromonas aeria]